MSFANIRMYNAVLPTFSKDKKKGKEKGDATINGDNPANREAVRKVMFDIDNDE